MPECNSPLGWQTSFPRIPVHYHSMPSPSDDALYRCSTDSKVHCSYSPLRYHYCWHLLRFVAGIFDEIPKVKASQLQKKSFAAFIFLLYHLRWQSFFIKVFRLLFSFNFENATLFKMDSPLMFMVHSAHSVKNLLKVRLLCSHHGKKGVHSEFEAGAEEKHRQMLWKESADSLFTICHRFSICCFAYTAVFCWIRRSRYLVFTKGNVFFTTPCVKPFGYT